MKLEKMLRLTVMWLLASGYFVVTAQQNEEKIGNNTDQHNMLLLILLDGFRWDYFKVNGLVGFPRAMEEGVHAEYMEALYPSESYPGYYSVATGLYGESHGMVLNYMYDENRSAFFTMEGNAEALNPAWWDDAEPIWITATRNNVSTALYLWPGGDVVIRGLKAKYVKPYESVNGVDQFQADLDNALNAFANNDIRFAQVYCEYTDKTGHAYGPFSAFLNQSVVQLDQVINRLIDQIKEKQLDTKLNVIIVSDHGMTKTDNSSVTQISLQGVLDPSDVLYVMDRGSHSGIYPLPGRLDKVYRDLQALEGVDVYKKDDIPDRYHFKHHRRVPPIFIVVKKGYFLTGLLDFTKQVPLDSDGHYWMGFHGYDPIEEDMNAIFLAWGPNFRKGHASPPIHITDPYNLMTRILQIPAHPNNGSWINTENMLLTSSGHKVQMYPHSVQELLVALSLLCTYCLLCS